MKGYIINFEPYNNDSRIRLYHILFGRNVYRNYRGKKYAYYVPGMLDRTPFYKIIEKRVFITSIVNVNIEQLEVLGSINVEEVDRDYSMEKLITGEEYWQNMALEKGLEFKRQLKNRRTKCKLETGQKGMF